MSISPLPKARWTEYAFPPYSYVSGCFPHPLSDPDGHGCHGPSEPASAPTLDSWRECELYLWGLDLYAHGYYWEAHEAWEGVWHAVGRVGPLASFLKALIKFAAAGVKAREGRVAGVRRHAQRASELCQQVQAQIQLPNLWGLQLSTLRETADAIQRDAAEVTAAATKQRQAAILPPLEQTTHGGTGQR